MSAIISTSYLVSIRVGYDNVDLCAQLLKRLNEHLAQTAGFQNLEIIRRNGGMGVDIFLLARFDSSASLEMWKKSEARTAHLAPIEDLAIADISRQQASGANIWFDPVTAWPTTPEPPLLWKRWALSLLAVYPLLIILVHILRPLTSQLPEGLGLFLVATILTGTTTSLIVPLLTRRLHSWLIKK